MAVDPVDPVEYVGDATSVPFKTQFSRISCLAIYCPCAVPIRLKSRADPPVIMSAYFPTVFLALRETRATVILRRKAYRLRKERGHADGGRYTARSEVEKVGFADAMRQSLLRPLSASSFRVLVDHRRLRARMLSYV
jgi:hypothetical protein